jgi:hypothetical protein
VGTAGTTHWYLSQEARAMLTRLALVRPFAVHETMVPAAALSPVAQVAIERVLIGGRRELRQAILDFLRWLAGPGRAAPAEQLQRRFTRLRLRFGNALTHFDLFTEVITQRSEHQNGVWLSGLDELAKDALTLPGYDLDAPPAVVYLSRGAGAAIRRARTRLPGGARNPVAIIKVPRERMIGHGIASSLVHECGHQAAALMCLVEGLRTYLAGLPQNRADPQVWRYWQLWISEIVADLWSVAKLGIGSTLGLIGVVSMPRWAVFRPSGDDPHPVPWLRVQLSAAIGAALYPHPQWDRLTRLWQAMYPPTGLAPAYADLVRRQVAGLPEFARVLLAYRPAALAGHSLGEALYHPDRQAANLVALWQRERGDANALLRIPPTLAFAVVGQARAADLISPERETRLLGRLLTYRALRSSLDLSLLTAERLRAARPVFAATRPAGGPTAQPLADSRTVG